MSEFGNQKWAIVFYSALAVSLLWGIALVSSIFYVMVKFRASICRTPQLMIFYFSVLVAICTTVVFIICKETSLNDHDIAELLFMLYTTSDFAK
jgi:hypothetical protein